LWAKACQQRKREKEAEETQTERANLSFNVQQSFQPFLLGPELLHTQMLE